MLKLARNLPQKTVSASPHTSRVSLRYVRCYLLHPSCSCASSACAEVVLKAAGYLSGGACRTLVYASEDRREGELFSSSLVTSRHLSAIITLSISLKQCSILSYCVQHLLHPSCYMHHLHMRAEVVLKAAGYLSGACRTLVHEAKIYFSICSTFKYMQYSRIVCSTYICISVYIYI